MPPKRGIVKSGNAGNSSKPSSSKTPLEPKPNEQKSLFPPGSKYPLSLLNERCQVNGWEKPNVDTRNTGNGFSFSVRLSRVKKKTSELETVRLEPHPPYVTPTAMEARHWGATYALYRFCNGLQLNRVLPPGPRDYWNILAAEHKNAPEHQKWMYEADPFAARKAVDERQAKAAKRKEEATAESSTPSLKPSPEFANAPEVKMATNLRDMVEDTIKKAFTLFPEAGGPDPSVLSAEDAPQIQKQLLSTGFTEVQVRNAISALSQPSPLSFSLLSTSPPLQACVEYLVLHVPESDLPQRFLPSHNSSNPFVTAAHSGTDDLRRRWLEDKAVKECGWPLHVVKGCATDPSLTDDWGRLVRALNCRLLGESVDDDPSASTDREAMDEGELEGFGAHFIDDSQISIPAPIAPLRLNVVVGSDRTFPTSGDPPPMYITSTSVPAYVRLHILSLLLRCFKEGTLIEPGETFVMAVVRHLEEEWAQIEDNGPPDVSVVLKHMLPQKVSTGDDTSQKDASISRNRLSHEKRKGFRKDERTDVQVKEEFDAIRGKEKFDAIWNVRTKLPAFTSRDKFLSILDRNRCVVVVGETGCGKTTQLPQFILDSLISSGKGSTASILITQPRRLSAIGVAARVSAERLEDGSVGYAIRGETKYNQRTKLLFCTTGVVLRRLASGDNLQGVTHVIVDEVHERSVDGDLLMLQLKELMTQHKKLKVILMSATINHEIFVKYFDNAPLLTIPGSTHPVRDVFLEDALPLINYRPSNLKGLKRMDEDEKRKFQAEYRSQGLTDDCVQTLQTITRSDRIDFELVSSVVSYIVSASEKPGGILIFLPGVQEIRQCIESLRSIKGARVLPLHANLSNDEQRLVFEPTSGWKIVVATNVAETSITIDDIIYVVDCGKVKETQYDPESGLTRLVEQWVTQAAAKQRRGRAGRTQPGTCYKLYTRKQAEKMAKFPIPEIQRVPLESIALTVKVMGHDVKSFLSRALNPPQMAAMEHALITLEELGAITGGGEVTPLGQHLATLPVDLRLGKMLVLGTLFQCLDPVLTVAACLSSKPLFLSPMDKREEANTARERFASGNSDLLTDVNAYTECIRRRNEGASQSAVRGFCEENFISPSTIRDVTWLRNELFSTLSSLNFVPPSSSPTSTSLNRYSSNTNLVKAVILGGLWPRVARVSLPRSAVKFDKVQAGTIQRENTAKEYKFFDVKNRGERVFLHPASVLFGETGWKSPFVVYFQKQMTSKIFLRDATEVPMYALLLFGGPVTVNHIGGGLVVGAKGTEVKLRAWPRIGVLVNQLRRLLDVQLERRVEGGDLAFGAASGISDAMLALLTNDGLSPQI